MKIIFVASGNKNVGSVSAFVQSQFDSLKRKGLDMVMFPVLGHGIRAHIRAAGNLRRLVRKEKPDIVHAHYSVCGYVATMATLFLKPRVVVSILGSFPRKNRKRTIVRFFIKNIWDCTLVKSKRTANQLGINVPVIPNGVNLNQFVVLAFDEARKFCKFESDKKYVIWCSNPSRPEKRYSLAQESISKLNDKSVVLYPVYDHPHEEVVKFMCAADVLLLTSISEGSPNVIKEAMACNCPIVSTDVGDVSWITQNVDGTYVSCSSAPSEIASLIGKALSFGKRTKGRGQLINLGLTEEIIAQRIISLYGATLRGRIDF